MEEIISDIMQIINNLSPTEIKVIIVVTAILLLILGFRLFGIGAVLALLLLYSLSYVLYVNDIFNVYEKRTKDNVEHMKLIEKELEKKWISN